MKCKHKGCKNKVYAKGECRNHRYREYQRKYEKTEKYKVYRRKYQGTEKYKAYRRKYMRDRHRTKYYIKPCKECLTMKRIKKGNICERCLNLR